jgi:hypothetical protein
MKKIRDKFIMSFEEWLITMQKETSRIGELAADYAKNIQHDENNEYPALTELSLINKRASKQGLNAYYAAKLAYENYLMKVFPEIPLYVKVLS